MENLFKRIFNEDCIGVKPFQLLNQILFESEKPLCDFKNFKQLLFEHPDTKKLSLRFVYLIENQYNSILPLSKIFNLENFFENIASHLLFLVKSPLLITVLITFLADSFNPRENNE